MTSPRTGWPSGTASPRLKAPRIAADASSKYIHPNSFAVRESIALVQTLVLSPSEHAKGIDIDMIEMPNPGVLAARRSVALAVFTVAMLVASMAVSAVPSAQGAQQNPIDPESGALLGIYPKPKDGDWTQNGIKRRWNQIESYAGRTLDVGHYYYKINQSFPTWREQWHVDKGRVPLVSWASVKTTSVTNGTYDTQINARAQDVKDFGEPILIRWFWEMDGNKHSSESGTPAQYIAAWRHIVGVFRDRGVTNAQFVWCPNADAFNRGQAEQWYPGDAWVDWLCADGYNWAPGKNGTEWRSLAEIFQEFHDWGVSKGKPMMIGETGVQERNSGEKGQWYRDAIDDLKHDLPGIDIMMLYDSDTIYNWWVDTSQSSINGFNALANDPYLNGGTVFADTFDQGVDNWAVAKNAKVDRSTSGTDSGAPVLKLAGDQSSGSYVRAKVAPGLDAMCIASHVKVSARNENLTIMRFQNDPGIVIGKVFLDGKTGDMWVKSEKSGKKKLVPFDFRNGTWYELTVCAKRGRQGSWEVRVDGDTVLEWSTKNLKKRIRSFRLGNGAAGDFTMRFDDVTAWMAE